MHFDALPINYHKGLFYALSANFLGRGHLIIPTVDAIDLEITRGQTFGFVGKSGSGKSTKLKSLAGLLNTAGGRVLFLYRRSGSCGTCCATTWGGA